VSRTTIPPAGEQLPLLLKGHVDLISTAELTAKLEASHKSQKPLVIKAGFDPSAPDLHVGHTVLIRKMRHFQTLGHEVVFVIGDFTGMIGDPTGKKATRPQLTREDVEKNAETYKTQIYKLLDKDLTRVVFNSSWLSPLGAEGMVKLAGKYTLGRMLERNDFKKRYQAQEPISLHEFLYPLAQAYDSVALKADVELGGTDQLFNLALGREIMKSYGLAPQCVLTTPLLEGLDGVEKMSKSLGNYIAIEEPPNEQFGKVMSISDLLLWKYYELLTDLPPAEIAKLKSDCESGAMNPRDAKVKLGELIVAGFHGDAAGRGAVEHFEKVFSKKETPDIIEEYRLPAGTGELTLQKLLVQTGLAPSGNEARRLITNGGVEMDGEKASDPGLILKFTAGKSILLKVGKRKFLKIVAG
jgi:tyrosyl-tRNA synthetase